MTTDMPDAEPASYRTSPDSNHNPPSRTTAFRDILAYATGEGANSLVMNTFFGFAMLYYTKAMGMSGAYAGIATGIVVLWDAITDPLMGHISDNTRSRFGRRHPYMLIGGLITVLCFYAVWAVPSRFRAPDLRIVAANKDQALTLWDVDSDQPIRTFDPQNDTISCIAVNPNSRQVLSGSTSGALRSWDTETGKPVKTFAEQGDAISCVAISPDGRWVASGTEDGTVKLWESANGGEINHLDGNGSRITALVFNRDGECIVSGSADGALKLWNCKSGEQKQAFADHGSAVCALAFSPNGRSIAAGTADGTLKLWDANNGGSIQTQEGHQGAVRSVAFTRDGRWLASGGDDRIVSLWDATTGQHLQTLQGHAAPVQYVAFGGDAQRLVSWSEDETLKTWDTQTWQPLKSLALPASPSTLVLDSVTPMALFWYLVAMNVLLRTGATVFGVPYIALGFEVCTDYNQRTTLQGVRTGLNMAVNLLGPALLMWSVFLRDRDGIKGETIAANYQHMGITFSVAAIIFIVFMVFATRKYAVDSRNLPGASEGNSLSGILRNLVDVLFDPYPRTVFIFIAILFVGVVMVTSMQMFVYVDFMEFEGWEKSLVHGSTMVAAGFGALLAAPLVRRLDKKSAIYTLLLGACAGNVMLVLLFATGWVPRGLAWGTIPVATLVFMVFHTIYHLGSTAATTVANSMMADVSEINRYRTGRLKDGTYSAMLSFVLKVSISVGLVLCGFCLDWIGVNRNAEHQTPEVARNLVYAAFIGGSVITLLAMFTIARYPVNRDYMANIQSALAEAKESHLCPRCGHHLEGEDSGTCPGCGRRI